MARLKSLLKSVVEDRSPRFLLATIALGVVVSLLAGFAIGYKVRDRAGAPGQEDREAGQDHFEADRAAKPPIASAPPT